MNLRGTITFSVLEGNIHGVGGAEITASHAGVEQAFIKIPPDQIGRRFGTFASGTTV
ncbi:MAG: hypothetical protein WCO26_13995 [Deltaproteobacteria bacterium]